MPYQKPATPEEALEHFGIIGMKWGIRRGSTKTGVGRIRSAAVGALRDSARRRNTASRLGFIPAHSYGLYKGGPIGALRTTKGQARVGAKQLKAADRIALGKTTTMDFLRAFRNTHMIDLVVTSTLKPNATGYDGRTAIQRKAASQTVSKTLKKK